MEHESNGDTNSNRRTRHGHQRIDIGTGGFGNKTSSGDHYAAALLRSSKILRRILET